MLVKCDSEICFNDCLYRYCHLRNNVFAEISMFCCGVSTKQICKVDVKYLHSEHDHQIRRWLRCDHLWCVPQIQHTAKSIRKYDCISDEYQQRTNVCAQILL